MYIPHALLSDFDFRGAYQGSLAERFGPRRSMERSRFVPAVCVPYSLINSSVWLALVPIPDPIRVLGDICRPVWSVSPQVVHWHFSHLDLLPFVISCKRVSQLVLSNEAGIKEFHLESAYCPLEVLGSLL